MKLLCLVTILLMLTGVGLTETYTAKTGPFTIEITSNESIDIDYIAEPMPIDNFNAYDATVSINDRAYEIEIQDYGQMTNIDLMRSITSYSPSWSDYYTSWDTPEIGGKPGLLGVIEKGDKSKYVPPCFVAAYSPDGFGNKGTVIAIIDVSADEKENFNEQLKNFENLIENMRIIRRD